MGPPDPISTPNLSLNCTEYPMVTPVPSERGESVNQMNELKDIEESEEYSLSHSLSPSPTPSKSHSHIEIAGILIPTKKFRKKTNHINQSQKKRISNKIIKPKKNHNKILINI